MPLHPWRIHRRTMLRGLGVAIALPFLDAMEAPTLFGGEPRVVPRKQPVRFATIYMPNGVSAAEWSPPPGPLTQLSPLLAPLAKVKDHLLVISNLLHRNAFPNDGHYAKCAAFLTGTTVFRTTGADLNAGGVSADQLAAGCLGEYTRLPSLELSTQRQTSYICPNFQITSLYAGHISWNTPTTPMARETDPKAAFDRLFRGQGGVVDAPKRPHPLDPWDDRSVLDFVTEDGNGLKGRLGVADQRKLDEYLTSVRDVERRLAAEARHAHEPHHLDTGALRELGTLGDATRTFNGQDLTASFPQRTTLMLDILLLALWSDTTRIATLMLGNEASGQNFSFLDRAMGSHHEISHHENKPEKLDQYRRINVWHMQQLAYLLQRMATIKEGKDSLLDNSMVLFGGGIRDGNQHDPRNLPILVAGGGGRTIDTGRHAVCKGETPLANLLVGLLNRLGIQIERFADSSGPLRELNL